MYKSPANSKRISDSLIKSDQCTTFQRLHADNSDQSSRRICLHICMRLQTSSHGEPGPIKTHLRLIEWLWLMRKDCIYPNRKKCLSLRGLHWGFCLSVNKRFLVLQGDTLQWVLVTEKIVMKNYCIKHIDRYFFRLVDFRYMGG